MIDTTVAYTFVFTGTVQRVGFRATTAALAQNYPKLKGWVRNMPDGTVEMHVQGPKKDIEELLILMTKESRLANLIDHLCKEEVALSDNLEDFHIQY
jgi:acylphosphatase